MVHDTVMPDYGGGGGSSSLGSPGTTVSAAHNVQDRGMTCSFAKCNEPTRGIPFCVSHLSQLNMPKTQQQSRNVYAPASSHSPAQTTVTERSQSQSQASPRHGRTTGPYVMRKSASTAGIRPPSYMASSLPATSHSIPSGRLPNERPSSGSRPWPLTEQHFVSMMTQNHNGNTDMRVGSNVSSRTNALSTPVESPPFSRPDGPSKRPGPAHDSNNHVQDQRQAQREALRTPRSRSREPDTSSSTTPRQSSIRDRESDNYIPSAQHQSSHILSRLRSQGQAAVRERNQFTPSSSSSSSSQPPLANFSLDTYVYNQDASVSPLPPPPGVKISSASDIAVAAKASSAAAALEKSYAAAMAAVSCATAPSSSYLSSPLPAISSQPSTPGYVYAYIDPRVHWTRARSKEWHSKKQDEIKARGGRKANVGMAAQRTARQKVHAAAAEQTASTPGSEPAANGVPSVWQGELPSNVVHNKDWMALVASFANDEEKRLKKAKRQAQLYRQRYGH